MNIVFVLATGMEGFVKCMKGNDYDYNNIQERSKICDRKKMYELNETMELSFEMMDVYYKGRKIDLRDYATYVEPFDEDAWYAKMAKKGFHFKAGVRLIFL